MERITYSPTVSAVTFKRDSYFTVREQNFTCTFRYCHDN